MQPSRAAKTGWTSPDLSTPRPSGRYPVADSFEPERALTDVVVAAVEPVVVVAPHPVRTSARVAIAAHASTAKRPLEERVEPVARRVRLTRSTGTMRRCAAW